MLAPWELPIAVTVLRLVVVSDQGGNRPLDEGALSQLRRGLADLPETEHPLGF